MDARRKLLLINPRTSDEADLADTYLTQPPLGLGMIAALTPEHWQIEILDENFDRFVYRDADLVGLTAFTSTAGRAYELAAHYRAQGIKTVMGGIHASLLPDEALHYVDSVVVGEGEGIWPKVIADFEQNRLGSRYEGGRSDLKGLVRPRRDLFHPGYKIAPIQTSRGCPLDCEFCSVTAFNGHRHRQRPVEEVLDELETIKGKDVFFADENIIGHSNASREWALRLFRGMIERKINKRWATQASLNFAIHDEVLRLAAQSGCKCVLIGIEAEDPAVLTEVNKKLNLRLGVDNYAAIFARIARHGIRVLGMFVFGMDGDNLASLRKRAAYIQQSSGIHNMQITCLTPLPGSRLFQRLQKEERLLYRNFPHDWRHYDLIKMVFQPKTMSAEEFNRIFADCLRDVYSPLMILKKSWHAFWATRSLQSAIACAIINHAYRRMYRRVLSYDQKTIELKSPAEPPRN